jgi:hypothetical protein
MLDVKGSLRAFSYARTHAIAKRIAYDNGFLAYDPNSALGTGGSAFSAAVAQIFIYPYDVSLSHFIQPDAWSIIACQCFIISPGRSALPNPYAKKNKLGCAGHDHR